MVKKIKLITYGCELCNKEYKNIDEAIKCEAQGIIGPEIKPGLVVRRHPGNLYEPYPTYNIFLEEEKSIGHNRRYNTLKLYDGYILEPF